uniref:Uncharacterized protein n=1 Tax=Rheinheimera sp. BAL341 TaxID=1708203 RepID=A0A486XPY0_9GAMM
MIAHAVECSACMSFFKCDLNIIRKFSSLGRHFLSVDWH